ncbi:Universal stress protein [Nonomuraea coxensis DSM 45129]|uniref:Universal stress protein n=1 Tax=Nonomuraea coxensis DSM 45129 TaxID=1122611 RepID=A0ABX8U0U7_9ACTN|nr:universal stress protein [Nonomuraea coxensis]QYC40243.1 Universal stress protein [Nonomuraea coxensis DSM 45129]
MDNELGVVVGYDQSWSSGRALRWGAAEAAARGLPLTVCHAWDWPYHEWPGELVPLDLVRRPAQRLARSAAAWVGRHYAGVPVNTLTDRGSPATVLAELSAEAALIVVGTRGHGVLGGLVAGSTSTAVAIRAACPVIVMRDQREADGAGEVLVGFDGSRASAAALGFAAQEAQRLDAPLTALIAGGRGHDAGEPGPETAGFAWEELGFWQRLYPELRGDVEVTGAQARPALLDRAREARLLVVGARGLGEVRGLLLGSISQAMVHHAPCPVAVVHGGITAEGDAGGPKTLVQGTSSSGVIGRPARR